MKNISTYFKRQHGFSLTEIMVVGGLTAGVALGFSTMLKNQSSAVKGIMVKVEVQNMQNIITDIMRNEANCVATVKNVSATAPSMVSPISLPAIMQYREVNGAFVSVPFYETGKTYDGIKITSMEIRPYRPSQDQTPAHKLEVKYEITAKIVGANSFSRKMELFFSETASPLFPDYPFRCNVGGGGATQVISSSTSNSINICNTDNTGLIRYNAAETRLEFCDGSSFVPYTPPTGENAPSELANATDTVLSLPQAGSCGGFRSGLVSCPANKFPVSCGLQDGNGNENEDSGGCWVNPASRGCSYTIDASGGSCDAYTVHCLCL